MAAAQNGLCMVFQNHSKGLWEGAPTPPPFRFGRPGPPLRGTPRRFEKQERKSSLVRASSGSKIEPWERCTLAFFNSSRSCAGTSRRLIFKWIGAEVLHCGIVRGPREASRVGWVEACFTIREREVPQQTISYDCGILALSFFLCYFAAVAANRPELRRNGRRGQRASSRRWKLMTGSDISLSCEELSGPPGASLSPPLLPSSSVGHASASHALTPGKKDEPVAKPPESGAGRAINALISAGSLHPRDQLTTQRSWCAACRRPSARLPL